MARFRAKMALLVFAMGLTGPAAFGDEPSPGRATEKTPELVIAASAAKKIDRDDANWRELTKKLRKAIEEYNPASVNVLAEEQTLEAFRGYCGKLLESGKSLVAMHEQWAKASEGLSDSLRKAPAYYRAAARAMREKAETMQFPTIKDRYRLTADIWEQLALKAEERAKDLSLDKGPKGVVDLVREENTFLTDFLGTLDALPRLSGTDAGRYGDLFEVLRRHATQSDELYRQLKRFRDKLKADPRAGAESE
jgi:hypothetical protein